METFWLVCNRLSWIAGRPLILNGDERPQCGCGAHRGTSSYQKLRKVAGLILNTGTYKDLLWVDVLALGVVDMVTNRSAKPSIVRTWLQFLAIPTYVSNFEENGFEDLETIKLICEKDLVEIGVDDQQHRQIILASVKILKEQGAAWVYLLLASQEQQLEKKKEELEEETQEDDGEELFALFSLTPSCANLLCKGS